jgi:hypothetical protein
MGATEEGFQMSDENKRRPDSQNKVMGLFCFETGKRRLLSIRIRLWMRSGSFLLIIPVNTGEKS